MDFEFPPDALMLRDMLRRFVQKEARPLEMKYFTAGSLAQEERARLRRAIEQLGLWGLTVPEEFGGGGLDLVTTCLIEEELGTTFVPIEMGEVPPMLYACAGEQVHRFLEPALAGNRAVITAAREPGALLPEDWSTKVISGENGFILNGFKKIATLPGRDDFLMVYAKAPEGLTAFLLDSDHPGLNTSNKGDIVLALSDCRVRPDAILGELGRALTLGVEQAPRHWIRLGARYVGLVERLIEMAVEHAKEWVALGAPLAVRPAIQRTLAELRIEVESARWLVYHTAWLADVGKVSVRVKAAQVRLATGEMLQRATDRVTMIYTGPGASDQIEPRRLVRSVVPLEALTLALDNARAVVAAHELHLLDA